MDAVHNLGHAKTIILIAHRLTTVQACDTIFMLEHGRLVAQGSYDELLDTSRKFRAMAVGEPAGSSAAARAVRCLTPAVMRARCALGQPCVGERGPRRRSRR